MKRYFVHYYRDFGNTYNLYWADSPEMENVLPAGAEQITRRQAEALARAERDRRKYDEYFSGYASDAIFPVDYPQDEDIRNDLRYELRGYIWNRRAGR